MIASPHFDGTHITDDTTHEAARETSAEAGERTASPRAIEVDAASTSMSSPPSPIPSNWPSNWPHLLVNDVLKAQLTLPAYAAHHKTSYAVLRSWLNTPAFQSELSAHDEIVSLRSELLASAARPQAIQKLITIIEQPLPAPQGRNPDADSRAFCRHADLSIRAINALFRHSRNAAPSSPRAPAPRAPTSGAPSPQRRGTDNTESTTSERSPSASESVAVVPATTRRVPPVPAERSEAEPVRSTPDVARDAESAKHEWNSRESERVAVARAVANDAGTREHAAQAGSPDVPFATPEPARSHACASAGMPPDQPSPPPVPLALCLVPSSPSRILRAVAGTTRSRDRPVA